MATTLSYDPKKIDRMADILKTIAHPIRLSVIEKLNEEGEQTVSQLVESIEVEQSLLSHHLNKMKDRGVLKSRRDGKNILYDLTDRAIVRIFACLGNCNLID